MLKRLFDYFGRNEKGLYWAFMWFIVSPWIRRIFEQYWGKHVASPEDRIAGVLYLLSFLIWSIGGRRLWTTLQKERFERARNIVVAFGGFFLLHILCFLVLIVGSLIIAIIFNVQLPEILFIILLLLIGFLCGCWMGHRFDRLIWFWCGLGGLVGWLTINFSIEGERIEDVMSSILWIFAVIMGAYFWRSRLIEEEDAAFASQQAQQLVEDEASIRK